MELQFIPSKQMKLPTSRPNKYIFTTLPKLFKPVPKVSKVCRPDRSPKDFSRIQADRNPRFPKKSQN